MPSYKNIGARTARWMGKPVTFASRIPLEWFIYIPDEGDWLIDYNGTRPDQAKEVYLRWADREDLPKGAVIWVRVKTETRQQS